MIELETVPYSWLKFYKGTLKKGEIIRRFGVCLEVNEAEKRRKINFYADGANYSEAEKNEILTYFNEQLLNIKQDEDTVQE